MPQLVSGARRDELAPAAHAGAGVCDDAAGSLSERVCRLRRAQFFVCVCVCVLTYAGRMLTYADVF
jgi:hypothetical protein